MNTWHYGWVLGVAALALMAPAAQADGPSAAASQVRIEALKDSSAGAEPQVRIWINGKEVAPGEALRIGEQGNQWRIETRAEAEKPRAERTADRPEVRPDHGFLGVMVEPLDEKTQRAAKVEGGVLVTSVMDGSPAAKAGLRADDVITAMDGKPLASPEDLIERIVDRRPGDKVRVAWSREGKRIEETVVLAPQPGAPGSERRPETPREGGRGEAFLGVMAAPLADEMREIAGTKEGVLVNSLPDNSPAARAGLLPGDVIIEMDGQKVASPDELVERVRGHKPGDALRIVYYRMGKRRQATAVLAERPSASPRGREGTPMSDLPSQLFGDMPQLREYLEKLRPQVEEWTKRFREEQGTPRLAPPAPPSEGGLGGSRQPPYDVGKDVGRILERLDRIEKRLNAIEERLERSGR